MIGGLITGVDDGVTVEEKVATVVEEGDGVKVICTHGPRFVISKLYATYSGFKVSRYAVEGAEFVNSSRVMLFIVS